MVKPVFCYSCLPPSGMKHKKRGKWKWIEYWKAFCRVSFMPKCLFLMPQMEFLGSVKAQNHQNWMDLSQVNRPMGLGQNFGTQLTFNGVQGGQNRLKISKTPNFQIFPFLRPQKLFVRPKIHRIWKFRYKQCQKWKKKQKLGGTLFWYKAANMGGVILTKSGKLSA